MYLNEILPGKWREDEWPEHIEVSHEASRFKSRRYVPRVNSANKSDALQNFMRTGLIGDDFHTRTRLVGEKGA